jgi:dTDP-glucose pyrophosphorylase
MQNKMEQAVTANTGGGKAPILAVLAAGMGSRYGGLKQVESIGPSGETLLDYSVYDALRAGYRRVVFIIRRGIEADFRERILARMERHAPIGIAFQELDSLIPPDLFATVQKKGRVKPWGTCHALLCAAEHIDAPFTVINADDFYGRDAYEAMAAFLRGLVATTGAGGLEGAIVPYRLERTLSATGAVTRGVCAIRDGYLRSVEELGGIERHGGAVRARAGGAERALAADAPVSMNFWGFHEGVMDGLREYFDAFLRDTKAAVGAECYIPLAVDSLIRGGALRVRVIPAESEWFGVTYKEDRDAARARIAALCSQDVYPQKLWT